MVFNRNFNVELLARSHAINFEFTPSVIATWDSGLWRGPRLLVPVHCQALVVKDEDNGPWADMRVRTVETDDGIDVQRPVPFTDLEESRAPGIYLHWSLPDALTRGEAIQTEEEPPPSLGDVSETPQPEPLTAEDVEFPLIPDRWLVVRISPGLTPSAPRRLAGWVIESEASGDAAVTPWFNWQEDRTSDKPPRWLTAVGEGDPAYMAYFDNTENTLGFYDPVSGIAGGPLTYLVTGWYSNREDDPLFEPQNSTAYLALLAELGWSLGDDPERVKSVAEAAQEAAGRLQLEYTAEVSSVYQLTRLTNQPMLQVQRNFADRGVIAPETFSMITASLVDMSLLQTEAVVDFQSQLGVLGRLSDRIIQAQSALFKNYYPRQMLCHGTIYDVEWNGSGGEFAPEDAGVPPPGSVQVAVGNTYLEALAAALAERSGQPEVERLLAAQHYGLLPILNEPDGIAKLESLLHAEDFASKPGGYVVETIEQGDLVPPPKDRERFVAEERRSGRGDLFVKTEFLRSDQLTYNDGMLNLRRRIQQQAIDERLLNPQLQNNRQTVPVRRALPRFWGPKDPNLLLLEPRRAFVHGEDGRFSDDDTLPCRLTTETISALNFVAPAVTGEITGDDIANIILASGQLPPEVRDLIEETLIMDPHSATTAVNAVAPSGTSSREIEVAAYIYQLYVSYHLNLYIHKSTDPNEIATYSPLTGVLPLPIAMMPWQKPWTPLHVEWEAAWYPTDFNRNNWLLEEHDFEYTADTVEATGTPEHIYTGRTLLTPSATAVVADRIAQAIEEENQGGTSADIKESLGDVLDELQTLDALATSLSGFNEALIGQFDTLDFDIVDAFDPDEDPSTELFPVRSGHLVIQRLRVVDAFGQIHNIEGSQLANPIRAEDVRVPGTSSTNAIRLNPRIIQPSRAMFRFLRADDDERDATKSATPVCGWVLPDHLDEALEVYDQNGISQGQVQTSRDLQGVTWQGVPGNPEPLGAPLNLVNPHLRGFIDGLLRWGHQDGTDPSSKESALSALLRMIDTTLWTVDPVGRRGDEHLSVLVGRPLAVVRAEIFFELEEETITEELLRTPFPFRLGAVNQFEDGLMGYFVNDDYTRFFPVHESIAAQARPSGPNTGFLGPISQVPDYYYEFEVEGGVPPVDAVDHPYIDTAPVIYLRPGQRVRLTLLLDPRGGVHLTSGVLPRKKIELMREQVAEALNNIILTFRVGPVLTDPEQVRMPLPEDIRGGWSWIRRTDATVWEEVEVVNATDEALLPAKPAEINEGWLKLSGAFAPGEEEEE